MKGGAQTVGVVRRVPRSFDRSPEGGQVDAIALQHLMVAMRERRTRRFFIGVRRKACFECIRDSVFAFAAQAREDTQMVCAELECVAKCGFRLPSDIFMPLMVVRTRQDFPISRIHLADAKMPVPTERLGCRALLGMLDHNRSAGIEPEFVS